MVVADFLDPLVKELEHFGSERLNDGPITLASAVNDARSHPTREHFAP